MRNRDPGFLCRHSVYGINMLIAWDPGGLIDVATHVVHYSNTFLILNPPPPSPRQPSPAEQTHWNRCRKSSFHVSAQQEKHVRHVWRRRGRGKGVNAGAGFVNGSAMETQFDFTLDNNQSVRCFDARMLTQKECSHTHIYTYTYPIKKKKLKREKNKVNFI